MTPHLRETEGGRRRWLPRPCLFASHRHAFCDKISSTCELCSLFPTQISISVSPVRSPVGGINLIILSARSVSLGPARLLALLSFGATPPSTNDTQGLISVQLVPNHSATFTCFFVGAFSPEPCDVPEPRARRPSDSALCGCPQLGQDLSTLLHTSHHKLLTLERTCVC